MSLKSKQRVREESHSKSIIDSSQFKKEKMQMKHKKEKSNQNVRLVP